MIIRPRSALGLKYVEITRGHSDDGFEDGDTIPLVGADADAGRVRRVLQHVRRRRRATAIAAEPARLRRRVRRPRRDASTPRSARCRPLLRDIEPVARNLVGRRDTQPRRASSARSARRRAIVAPVAEAQADAVRATSTRTFTRARDGRAAVHPGLDHRGAARRSTPRSARSRSSGRSCATPRRLFRELRPGVARAARRRARPRRRARGRHADAAAHARRSTAASPSLLDALQAFADGPAGAARHRAPDRDARVAGPDARLPHAGADACNYVTLWFRNVVVAAVRGRRATAPGSGSSSSPRRRARTTRAARPRRPANGADDARQPPAREPVPEHGVAGPAARSARPATSRTSPGRTVIGNVPGNAARRRRRATPLMAARARRRRAGRSPVTIGLIALAIVLVAVVPRLHQGHPVHARRSRSRPCSSRRTRCARTRRCGSPASRSARSRRSSPRRAPTPRVVTMEIDDDGLPIHKDATAKIRPRIFLEGNFFVDLQPGHAGGARRSTTATRSRSRRPRRRCSSTRC